MSDGFACQVHRSRSRSFFQRVQGHLGSYDLFCNGQLVSISSFFGIFVFTHTAVPFSGFIYGINLFQLTKHCNTTNHR